MSAAVNDPNRYTGPGTGYHLDGERWQLLQQLPHELDARTMEGASARAAVVVVEKHVAIVGNGSDDVVIAIGPAFADGLHATIGGLAHRDVIEALMQGVREAGAAPRLVRVRRAADVAFIGHDGALLAGSRVAVGIQSKGTTVIHRADLQPLDNLELFGMAPSLTLDPYRAIGRNAAGYALGKRVGPVPTVMDNFARAKLIVRTTLLHARETAAVARDAPPLELELVDSGGEAAALMAGADAVVLDLELPGLEGTRALAALGRLMRRPVPHRRPSVVASQSASVSPAISFRLVSSSMRKSNSFTSISGTTPTPQACRPCPSASGTRPGSQPGCAPSRRRSTPQGRP